MIVNSQKYEISILVLLMEHELEVTITTIETILESNSDSVKISVLLNGGRSLLLKKIFDDHKQIFYYESDVNLGVAGGRNFLLRTNECKSADIVLIIDNDVIPPSDYVKNIVTFLLNRDDAGVVGAIVADYTRLNPTDIETFKVKGPFKNDIWVLKSEDIKKLVLERNVPESYYHLGANPDYYFAYFSAPFVHHRFFADSENSTRIYRKRFMKNSLCLLTELKKGLNYYSVSTVAGCSQAFRRSLVDEIGFLNEWFNPFGFEDVDFCVRSVKSGYKNYITSDVWLLHGTDQRHENRSNYQLDYNRYRGYTRLCVSNYKSKIFLLIILRNMFFETLIAVFRNKNIKLLNNIKPMFQGFNDALK